MAFVTTTLIVISIILIFLSQEVNLRVKHTRGYVIDIDTPFLGISIDTSKEGNKKDKKKGDGSKATVKAYYYAISHLVSHSNVAVGKAFSCNEKSSVATLFSTYTVLYSLLSLVLNRAEEASLAKDFQVYTEDAPNIDVAFRFLLIHLIISLLLLQYYKRKETKERI